MRAFPPRCAAVAVVCASFCLPASSASAEKRPSELSIRVVTPAPENRVELAAQATPVLQAPLAAREASEIIVQQASFETTLAASAAEAAPVAPAIHVEAPAAGSPASAPPAVRRPPIFPGRPPVVQLPRRMTIQPAAQRPAHRSMKPFEEYQPDPTISPYLNLYRDEDDEEGVPNYFAFVRPQFEQQELNRTQRQEMQQMRGNLQNMTSGSVSMPATGLRARYMDTAQFYGGRTR